jgi:hypothetical protein
MRIDSSPWAEDHSSPRSPRHVLQLSMSFLHDLADYSPENRKAHLAGGINIWVEAGPASICGNCENSRCFSWVFSAKLDRELEEAKLIGCIWWANDQGADMANINVTPGYCEREIRAILDLMELAGDPENRLIRHVGRFRLTSLNRPVRGRAAGCNDTQGSQGLCGGCGVATQRRDAETTRSRRPREVGKGWPLKLSRRVEG